MTSLTINPVTAVSSILLLISFITFIFAYNTQVKKRVDKDDLTDLKTYVDQQDRSVHHRIDEVNGRIDKLEDSINKKLDILINKLIK